MNGSVAVAAGVMAKVDFGSLQSVNIIVRAPDTLADDVTRYRSAGQGSVAGQTVCSGVVTDGQIHGGASAECAACSVQRAACDAPVDPHGGARGCLSGLLHLLNQHLFAIHWLCSCPLFFSIAPIEVDNPPPFCRLRVSQTCRKARIKD